jgi:hypothetical protein
VGFRGVMGNKKWILGVWSTVGTQACSYSSYLNEGSSLASLLRAMPIFSWSALVLGSTATLITGAGKSMRSRMHGLSREHRVSPVTVVSQLNCVE